ncbi:hypothetical protein AB2301_17785 [Vibrio cholerae]|uniref:hypothetical protein n=1 Tax=Vibrio cholerae TaxID=666 RepID=UPI0034BFD141|nr:hypothetical protein [Vibrio cholerae]
MSKEKLVLVVVLTSEKLVYTFSSDAYENLNHAQRLSRFKSNRLRKFSNLEPFLERIEHLELFAFYTSHTKKEIADEWISNGYKSLNK